jgi:hypothetical protein
MSLTKLSLVGNNLIIPSQREIGKYPGWERENRKSFFMQCITTPAITYPSNNETGENLLLMLMPPAMKQLQRHYCSLPTPQNEHTIKNHYMIVNSNLTAPQQNKKKLPVSNVFPFIADVVDTGDQPLLSNISGNFRKNLKWPLWDTQWPAGN